MRLRVGKLLSRFYKSVGKRHSKVIKKVINITPPGNKMDSFNKNNVWGVSIYYP